MLRPAPLLAVSLLFAVATFTGINRLTGTGIYADEGTQFAIAGSILAGETRYLAIGESTLLFAKGPVFPLLLAGWWQVAGTSSTGWDTLFLSRFLIAVLHLVNACLIFQIVKQRSASVELAVFAALLLAFMPATLPVKHYVFSYHFATLMLLLFWFSWAHWHRSQRGCRRWLIMAALALGIGLLTDLIVWSLLPGYVFLVARFRKQDGLLALVVALAPAVIFLLHQYSISPEATVFDLHTLWLRITSLSFSGQLRLLGENGIILIRETVWFPFCLLGVLTIPRQIRAEILWFLVIPLLIIARSVALTGLASYHLIPWLPWIAFLSAGLIWSIAQLPGRKWPRFAWLKPVIILVGLGIWMIAGKNDAFAVVSLPPSEVQEVAHYLQTHRDAEELVLTTPALAWKLPGQVADFQMALAAEGLRSVHIPNDLPNERFVYDPRFSAAEFAVLDEYLFRWGIFQMPDLVEKIAKIETDWQIVFETATMKVYRR